ncbi:MAG: formate dehydrogenase subunit gamma [Pelomonas sp.]|nr:formate dehydrogenase subunit gamma [Roseateles sp.]
MQAVEKPDRGGAEVRLGSPGELREKLRSLVPPPLAPAVAAAVNAAIAAWRDEPGGLLPLLHAVQDALGYVPPEALPAIAKAMGLSRAEVHGVVSYYHHFRDAPSAPHRLELCRAEACQAMGADALLAHAERRLGCGLHGRSADGRVALEPVYCLGLCSTAPSALLDGQPQGRVTPERLDALLAQTLGAKGAAAGHAAPGRPRQVAIPSGDRPMYASDEGQT